MVEKSSGRSAERTAECVQKKTFAVSFRAGGPVIAAKLEDLTVNPGVLSILIKGSMGLTCFSLGNDDRFVATA